MWSEPEEHLNPISYQEKPRPSSWTSGPHGLWPLSLPPFAPLRLLLPPPGISPNPTCKPRDPFLQLLVPGFVCPTAACLQPR